MFGNYEGKRKPSIFFFCCSQGPPVEARYQYGIVPLAEGLAEIGIKCYSNVDYWHIDPHSSEYLFSSSDKVRPEDCDIVVLNDRWFRYGNAMPKSLFKKNRKYLTVYIDCADGVFTRSFKPEWRRFDIIFKAHFNKRMLGVPKNMKPWAFGLTKRIISATNAGEPWGNRQSVFLSNFRVQHSLRKSAKDILHPLLQSIFTIDTSTDAFEPPSEESALIEWKRTGRRHNPAYYPKLNQAQAISCFGGHYAHRIANPILLRKVMNRFTILIPQSTMILCQWDSFRLWEAFSAGCLVFHVDLSQEGCQLPVMPKNGDEYVGVDLKNPQKAWEWITNLHPDFSEIAYRGRQWALANFSPLAVAKRFLLELGYYNSQIA